MAGVNKVILLGNVGSAPEIKYLEGGKCVATWSLATSERYKNHRGELIENTEWHNVVAWGKLAEVIEKYVRKGSRLYIEGKIRTRSWEDNAGVKKYRTEIVADSVSLEGGGTGSNNQQQGSGHTTSNEQAYGNAAQHGDDLPF